jgi:hypothetical protein
MPAKSRSSTSTLFMATAPDTSTSATTTMTIWSLTGYRGSAEVLTPP